MTKKTFKNNILEANQANPAEAFISMPTPKPIKAEPAKERKSVRVNLLFKPSVKTNIEKIATMKQTSLNDMIGLILEDYIEKNSEIINKYNSVFNQ